MTQRGGQNHHVANARWNSDSGRRPDAGQGGLTLTLRRGIRSLPIFPMSKYLILFSVALLAGPLFAEQEFITTQSLSKQFVIYGPKGTPAPSSRLKRLPLDPTFLTVSCERIKQSVLAQLSADERLQIKWRTSSPGKIYVVLHPGTEQHPLITPLPGSALPAYRIDLPNLIDGARLIEAITEVVLLEIANRNSDENFSQLPRWFSQGIAEQLKSASPETLLLQANQPISSAQVKIDPIAKIRKELETFSPLTFDELSWPEKLPPERFRYFDKCAQLFVHELLRLKDGESCVREFLDELPRNLNWQVAFLRAFRPHFQQLIDVEKWWGLRLVGLTGRDASQLWSREQSLEGLNSALRVPVQWLAAEAAPNRTDLTLQQIVSNWDPPQQKIPLQKVVNQLRALRIRIQPEMVLLLDEYAGALANYLENDERQGVIKRIFLRSNLRDLRQSTCERLDALDRRRAACGDKPKPGTREEAMLSALEAATRANSPSTTRKE